MPKKAVTSINQSISLDFSFSCRTALTHYLDINNPPRTNVLRELSIHTSDPEEAAKLKAMGTGLDKEGYNDWVVDQARYGLISGLARAVYISKPVN